MTNYRRNLISGGTYFFTVNLADRQSRLLTENIGSLRAAFRYTRLLQPFTIDAIVVLPDHLHTIWTLPEGVSDFAFAGGSSKQRSRVARRAGSPRR